MDVVYTLIFTFIFLPVIFCVLFIIFLVISVKRGKRIKELEKELNYLKRSMPGQAVPNAYNPYIVPQQVPVPGAGQPEYSKVPEIRSQGYMPSAPASYQETAGQIPAMEPVPQVSADIPGQVQTPSWAMSPAQANAVRAKAIQAPAVDTGTAPKKKFFSSINITFGIGVLLLTIVGATFMTGSWPWMTEEVRAICLVLIVFTVYGMAFLAGKVLKLQQTEFALYTLASLLGPIVIVGMGSFNLIGSSFSFSGGTGWLVATVAALVLTVTSVGGRFLFREKTQADIYQGTFYIALTWLVVFLCGQIGHSSGGITEWGMICLGLATLALVFRIVAVTGVLEAEAFFRIYSEIILYVVAGLLFFSSVFADGALFGASIIEFAAFVLFAVFSKQREWIRYLVPFIGMTVTVSWIVFGGKSEDAFLVSSTAAVIIVVLYAVHKATRISTVLSDLLFLISLGSIPAYIAVEKVPAMGVFSCVLTVILILFRLIAEPVIAEKKIFPEGIFREAEPVPLQVVYTLLATAFYYLAAVMLHLTIEVLPYKGHFYYTLTALVPVMIMLAVRAFLKDDLRIRVSGYVLSVISVIAALVSSLSLDKLEITLYMHANITSWILTLTVIVMALFFMVKPLKEKHLSYAVMFWSAVCLNAFSIGVYMTIAFYTGNFFSAETMDLPASVIPDKIAALVFLGLNTAVAGAVSFIRRRGKGLTARYASGMKYFFVGFAMLWFIRAGMLFEPDRYLLIISVIFAVLLAVFDSEFFSVIPVLAAEYSIVSEFRMIENNDLVNVLCIAGALLFAGLGRLIFRRSVFTTKSADYLSLTSCLFLFGLNSADYIPLMVFLTLALLVMNFAGRVRIPVRVIVSIFASLICFAAVAQPFFDYPDVIALEVNIILLMGTLLLICKVIRPASGGVMKYIWFTGVSLSLIAEGVSAAVTGEVPDLVIVGTASFGIFIFAFIRRNRLWFILGIVSMISVAVYLSVAFWSSLVWLIYLFVAGTILVVMASVNEWGKRHNKDGKKRRFFEEWTW